MEMAGKKLLLMRRVTKEEKKAKKRIWKSWVNTYQPLKYSWYWLFIMLNMKHVLKLGALWFKKISENIILLYVLFSSYQHDWCFTACILNTMLPKKQALAVILLDLFFIFDRRCKKDILKYAKMCKNITAGK